MSNTEEWKLQASFKTPGGTLINVRAGTGLELGLLIGDVKEIVTQISSVEAEFGVAHTLVPLGTTPSTVVQTPIQSSAAVSASVASATPTGHTCAHGARMFKSGSGAKGPWAAWMCPTAKDAPDKCPPDWVKLGS